MRKERNDENRESSESREAFLKKAGLITTGGMALGALGSLSPALATTRDNMRTKPLKGKVAMVTGAARNMGRGFAVLLGSYGADVLVHYHRARSRAEAASVAKEIERAGSKAAIVSGDISKVAAVKKLYDKAEREFGRIDIVVNNAGALVKKPIVQVTPEEFDRVFGINAKGTFFSMREAARRIKNNGRIINITTSILTGSTPMYSAYVGSKASVEYFTRALSKELAKKKVTVNNVAPGPIDTDFFHRAETARSLAYIKKYIGIGKVDDVVPAVGFLALPEAGWINGQTIFVNGGYATR